MGIGGFKNWLSANPAAAPNAMPRTIETGIPAKSIQFASPPCAMPTKVENSTMTKISSQDAPAKTSCGMLFAVP